MAAFIVYDTQNIIEKVRMGNRDVIQHALDLFFDVLSMFRRLLIILTQKVSCLRKITTYIDPLDIPYICI